jgi:hypothetical protein
MIDFAPILEELCPGREFGVGEDYESIVAFDGGEVPTLKELEAVWPKVQARRHNERMRVLRQAAFAAEADPLFLKWQAKEVEKKVWSAKRAEIRERYPYVDELE